MIRERVERVLAGYVYQDKYIGDKKLKQATAAILHAIQDEVETLRKEETTPGKDCKCEAWGQSECGCYADWTDWSVFNLAIDKIKELFK
jgi:hypothetical protein